MFISHIINKKINCSKRGLSKIMPLEFSGPQLPCLPIIPCYIVLNMFVPAFFSAKLTILVYLCKYNYKFKSKSKTQAIFQKKQGQTEANRSGTQLFRFQTGEK